MINNNLLKIETRLYASNLWNVHSQIWDHSERVSEYIKEFSEYLKLNKGMSKRLTELGSCHDIGKYGVPHSILAKPSKLTVEEFDTMTGSRCYRDSLSIEEALNEIRRNSGSQFDPKLSSCFMCFIHKYDFQLSKEESYYRKI